MLKEKIHKTKMRLKHLQLLKTGRGSCVEGHLPFHIEERELTYLEIDFETSIKGIEERLNSLIEKIDEEYKKGGYPETDLS